MTKFAPKPNRALIFGGTSGIGLSLAKAFARVGADSIATGAWGGLRGAAGGGAPATSR